MSLYEKKKESTPEETEIAENKLSAKTRASIWLILAATVFVCAVVTCLVLIGKSAGSGSSANTVETHVEDIKYVAATTEKPDPNASATGEPDEPELIAPVSVNDSTMLNILIAGVDHETEQTDMLMIISIDTEKKTPSMLSIPRDTYIAGDYDMPKINRVYDVNGERGVDALQEAVENMVGFRLDKYLVFDEVVLSEILELTGEIEFEVPEEPNYHTLIPGEQMLSGIDAFGLFRYNEDYTDVETEPYKVQRDFMAKILDSLLAQQDELLENSEAICSAANTDLAPEELAYLGKLLENARFAAAFSRALPGEEITISGEDFYQVDPVAACEILNGHFNPLEDELTEYDVQFRQKQGDSGVGEMPNYGFGGSSGTTSQSTENTDATEAPTEEPSETETPEPIEPIEPIEPGGDE